MKKFNPLFLTFLLSVYPILQLYGQTINGNLDGTSNGLIELKFEILKGSIQGFISSNGKSQSRSDRASAVLGNLPGNNAGGNGNGRQNQIPGEIVLPLCLQSIDQGFFEVSLDSDLAASYLRDINGKSLPVNITLGKNDQKTKKVKSENSSCEDGGEIPLNIQLPDELSLNRYEIFSGQINLIIKAE